MEILLEFLTIQIFHLLPRTSALDMDDQGLVTEDGPAAVERHEFYQNTNSNAKEAYYL